MMGAEAMSHGLVYCAHASPMLLFIFCLIKIDEVSTPIKYFSLLKLNKTDAPRLKILLCLD